jgi:hypothetical protein
LNASYPELLCFLYGPCRRSHLSVRESLVGQPILSQIYAEAKRKLRQQILRLLYSRGGIGLMCSPDFFAAEFSQAFKDFGDFLFVLAGEPGGFPALLQYLANSDPDPPNSGRRIGRVSVV